MEPVKVKIVGVSGTPIKGGNCDTLVQLALETARGLEGVETDFITLADKKIAMCKHCQWCIEHRARCNVKDDLTEVQDRMFAADGLILGAPAYNRIISPQILLPFNRGREEAFFTHRMRGKPSGHITLGWFGFGMDFTLQCLDELVGSWGLIPVARGSAVTSTAWRGVRADYQEHGVLDDLRGTRSVRGVGRRVAEVAKMLKYAREAGVVEPIQRAPRERAFVDGVWRNQQ